MFRLRHILHPANKANSYTEDCAQHAPFYPLQKKCSSPILGESNKILARKILHPIFQIDLSLSILFREIWPKKGEHPCQKSPNVWYKEKLVAMSQDILRKKDHAIKGV